MSISLIRHYQAFHATIETGSTTEAARRLYVSQPAISNLISKLEQHVGFKLFERAGGKLMPTQEALYLDQHVKSILFKINALPGAVEAIRDMRVGQIRLAVFPGASMTIMPELLADFRAKHPGIILSMQTETSPKIQSWMAELPFDLGLVELPQRYGNVEIEEFTLHCVCLLPEEHPLAELDVVTPKDLDGVDTVSLFDSHMTSFELDRAFREAGVERRVTIEVSLFAIACDLVRRRSVVAIVDPINGSHHAGNGLTTRPFVPTVAMKIGMLHPYNQSRSRAVDELADKLRGRLQQLAHETRE